MLTVRLPGSTRGWARRFSLPAAQTDGRYETEILAGEDQPENLLVLASTCRPRRARNWYVPAPSEGVNAALTATFSATFQFLHALQVQAAVAAQGLKRNWTSEK